MDELMTIVNNIEALLQQIKQSSAGEATKEDAPPEEQVLPPMESEEVSPEIVKSIARILKGLDPEDEKKKKDEADKAKKSAEGSTASDDAKTLLDDQPEVNLENISDVAKAFIALASQKNKSTAETRMFKSMEALAERVVEQDRAITSILQGLGVADQVQKAADAKKQAEHKPMYDQGDVQKTLDYIRREVGINPESKSVQKGQPDQHVLQKSLIENDGEALKAIFSGRKF